MSEPRKVYTMRPYKEESVNFKKGGYKGESGKDFMRKSDLEDGEYYFGDCRNASCARWSASDQEFTYMRTKFRTRFPEQISHPEDFHGSDVFVPYFKCYPTPADLVPNDEVENE